MFKFFFFLVAFFLFANEVVLAQNAKYVGNIQHKILENGMEVYVISDHSMPIVAHILLYKVGAANESAGKSGLAHLLEHVMFRSTKNNNDVHKVLQDLGGYFNAFTSSYFTVYYEVAHKKSLSDIMKIESDRMRNLDFIDDLFLLERKIVLEERKMRIDNLPKTRLIEEMQSAFYRNDKSWQVAGWEHEIKQLTKDDAQIMYDYFYNPDNALLVISGDVTLEEIEPLLLKHYAKIPKSKHGVNQFILTEPKHLADLTINFVDENVKEQELIYFFNAPNMYDQKNLSLLVGNHILGMGKTSRLYSALVANDLAYNVQSEYDSFTKSDAVLSLSIVPNGTISFEKIEAKIQNVINELVTNGITTEELEMAKSDLKMELIQMQDGVTKKAIFMALNLGMGFSTDYVKDLYSTISKISVDDVNGALKEVFINSKSVKGYLLNKDIRS